MISLENSLVHDASNHAIWTQQMMAIWFCSAESNRFPVWAVEIDSFHLANEMNFRCMWVLRWWPAFLCSSWRNWIVDVAQLLNLLLKIYEKIWWNNFNDTHTHTLKLSRKENRINCFGWVCCSETETCYIEIEIEIKIKLLLFLNLKYDKIEWRTNNNFVVPSHFGFRSWFLIHVHLASPIIIRCSSSFFPILI